MRTERIALLLGPLALLVGCAKPPLVPDAVWGPTEGSENAVVACSTSTTDPSGGEVAYQFDWGDGTQSAWSALMAGGTAFGDTHTWSQSGTYGVKARARNASNKASDWSGPFYIFINPGEGKVRWTMIYADPEDPEDSSDLSLNTFGIGTDGTVYIGSEYGAVVSRSASGSVKWFPSPDGEEFPPAAPAIGDDGTVYISCANESLYALNANLTRKWSAFIGGEAWATAAIGAGGELFVQNLDDSCYCLEPDGSQRWSAWTGGGISSPALGTDGTVYVGTDGGLLYALSPADGTRKGQYPLGTEVIAASPAIDAGRGAVYVVNEEGDIASVDAADISFEHWSANVGAPGTTPVIGADGRVYVGGGGKLHCLDPEDGNPHWSFQPPLVGTVSTPAVTQDGYVYTLVSLGKKDLEFPDSLYAVNPDGTRRWAVALGEGTTDDIFSAPKLDADGNIYVASGTVGWSVRGISPPAQSSWPQFGRDPQNSGRAR